MARVVVVSLLVLTGTPLALLATGKRVLISETKVEPGQRFVVEEYGDLGKNTQASLVCRYFTGRSTLTTVFWYSPNGFMGKDSCPFLIDPP